MRFGLIALTVVFLIFLVCLILEWVLRRRHPNIRSAIRIACIKRHNQPMTSEEILAACSTFMPEAVHAVIEDMLVERSLDVVSGQRYRMK
jgi:hypothetical protein